MQSPRTIRNAYFALFLSLFGLILTIFALADDATPPVNRRPDRTVPGGPRFSPPARGIPQRRETTPPVDDRPTRTVTAGPRDECLLGRKPLAALIPVTSVGLTTAEFPTWVFNIPQTSAREAEFNLRDENNEQIYKTNLRINGKPDVISISIPASSMTSALAVGKVYRWEFALRCKTEDRSKDKIVGGFIQRIEPSADLIAKLESAKTMRDRLNIYAQAGIWHETIAILAQLRRDNPNDSDLAKDWASLLKQIGLNEITEDPLIQPYSLPAR